MSTEYKGFNISFVSEILGYKATKKTNNKLYFHAATIDDIKQVIHYINSTL